MMPIDFEGANITMEKPKGMTDEQCLPLRAMRGIDDNGVLFFVEVWQPNKEDVEAIVAGRPVIIQVLSAALPPIAMWTVNENNEPNC